MTAPTWQPVDADTADLLSLLADDGSVSTDYEWDLYVECLEVVAMRCPLTLDWTIDPNALRDEIAGRIQPQRVGAFCRRAVLSGLVEYTGEWVVSTDLAGKNAGKPCRELRWIGGQS